jgi:hypothetical protein
MFIETACTFLGGIEEIQSRHAFKLRSIRKALNQAIAIGHFDWNIYIGARIRLLQLLSIPSRFSILRDSVDSGIISVE